jgi:hypothetical protein
MDDNVDIIEPFPNELLFSWFIRMAKWYGFENLSTITLNKMHLGPSSDLQFNMFIPKHLDYLVDSINLPTSIYFASVYSVIEKLSILPLYFNFSTDELKGKIYHICKKNNSTRSILQDLNIKNSGNYNIKICLLCCKDKNEFYLDREHQIQNNVICYKHKSRLNYIEFYHNKAYNLNQMDKIDYKNCIEEDDISIALRVKVALAIHEIFEDKLLSDSLDVIKGKLRKKLKELNYMDNEKNYIIDINKFWEDFKKYNFINIDNYQLFNILFTTYRNITPVAYITIILFLFNSIENFKKYDISFEESKRIYHHHHCLKQLYKYISTIKKSINYYNNELKRNNILNFEVVENISFDKVIIKHLVCDYSWPINKSNLKVLKNCPKCKVKKFPNIIEPFTDEYEFLHRDPKDPHRFIVFHKRCKITSSIPIKKLEEGQGCVNCRRIENFKQKLFDLVGDEYILMSYKGHSKDSIFIHNISNCMKEIHYRPNNFMALRYCPKCERKKSYQISYSEIYKV